MSDKAIAKLYRLVFAAVVAGSLIFHIAILWESRHKIAAGYGDFIIFYTGAQIVADGKSKELFKIETQNAYQAKFDVPQLAWPLPFNHAPYELFLFLPLIHLSFPLAHAIWSGANLILLALMLRWLLAYVPSPHSFFIAASVFAWFPTMEAFRLGQDSILSAALLLGVFVALKRKRDGWAGFVLALGLYKPQLVLPMAGAFLVARQWYSIAVFTVTAVLLVAVSLMMVGIEGAFDLISILRSMGDYSFIIDPRNMPNVRGLSYMLLQPDKFGFLAGAATIAISLALYALCLYVWRGKFDAGDSVFDLKFALVVATTVLICYHLYSHDLFPVALSLILLFRHVSSGQATHWALPGAYYILSMILLLPVVPRYLIESRALGWGAVPILAFYSLLVVEIFRQRNQGRETSSGPVAGA
jgi:hypothetical protein